MQPQLRTSAAPQLKDIRNRQEENIWAKLRECDLPKRDGDTWRTGSPREEARALFRMIGRNGDGVETLRQLIGVNDRELAELRAWAACTSPTIAVRIENMLRFRNAVLVEFDRLLTGVENAHRGDSSQAENA